MNLSVCALLGAMAVGLAACGAHAGGTHPGGAPAASAPVPATQFTPSADGVRIGWHRYGQGDTAVVLIHGWATDSSIWRAQLPVLTARYSVVTLDLGGQGESGTDREAWTIAHYAQDVAAVVSRFPASHIVLVGDGLGGPVALEAAPLIGARLSGIIGVETFRTLGLGPPQPSRLDHELLPFRNDFAGEVRQFVSSTLLHADTDPATARFVSDLMSRTPPDRALAALTDLNRLDYSAILPAVKVPIVVIDSDLGGAVDVARLEHAAARLNVMTLADTDSFAMLDAVPRFNAALLQALSSLATQ